MTKICTRPGCEKKRNARGWCSTHYNNWKRRGDPLQFADPKVTKKKQCESAKKRIIRDGFSPGMQRKGEPGLQKGKKLGPSPLKNRKLGPKSKETRKKISKSKTGITPNFSDDDIQRRKQRWTGKNNPNFGGLTEQQKSRIGITRKKGFKTGKIKSHRKGTHHTPEAKEKNRQKHLGKVPTDKAKKNMSIAQNKPETLQANRERRSKQAPLPTEKTKPNLHTRKILSDAGVLFQTEIRIQYQDKPKKWHKIDILIPPNRIIEVIGTYHHADPRKYDDDDWITLHNKKIKAIDVRNDEKILLDKIHKLDYEILVVWEIDLKKDLDNTTKKILKFANSETLS